MTTYNTQNPVPSVDVRDLYDNAQNLDRFINGSSDFAPDRFGVSRQTLQGIRNASQYQVVGAYAAGLQFTSYNQAFSYLGEFYAPSAGLTLPYTTTGAGAAEIAQFRSVGDAILRSDLAGANGSAYVYDDTETVKDRLNPIRAIVSVESFRDAGLSDSNTIRAALDYIGENLANAPATLVFEASRIYTINRTGDLKLINNLNIDLNGAYLIREASSEIKTTLSASASVGQSTISLSYIPDNWEAGDYLTAYSDNTDANTSRTGVRITSINRSALTVTMASGFGEFGAFTSTIPAGTTIAKNFQIFSGRPSIADSGTQNAAGINENIHIYNGSISGNSSAQTNNSWRYSTEIILHSRGGSIHDVEFIAIAGECIVGHGLRVYNNNFKVLSGSAFHTSMNDASLAQSSCSWFTDNYVSDVCLATNAVNGHCEGAITFSWGAGELFVCGNDMRNGSESILGGFGPSSGENADKWLKFDGNICRNFIRVFDSIIAPIEGVHVHGNILSFCGPSTFQMEQLLVSPTCSVGDNIEIGDTSIAGAARASCANFGVDLGDTIAQVKIWARSQKLLSDYGRLSDCTTVIEGGSPMSGMLCSDTGSSLTAYHSVSGPASGSFFTGWYPAIKTYRFLPNVSGAIVDMASSIKFTNLLVFADNAAATAGGLVAGQAYRTPTGNLMVRY